MLYLEELVDSILAEEGQTLMGLEFLTQTLGLTMKKIELLFKKSALEYSRRRPIKETRIFNSLYSISSTGDSGLLKMPEGTLSVNAVRYGVLPNIPRFSLPTFGEIGNEFFKPTLMLKVWPPIAPLKVTYTHTYTLTSDVSVKEEFFVEEGEGTFYDVITNTFKQGSLKIHKGELSMSEVGREDEEKEESGIITTQTIVRLSGDLGSGMVNLNTKEMELELNDTTAEYLTVNYKPLYKTILELDLGDYVFTKLFACKILEALASLRDQATQLNLHNIDLTTDDLSSRVRSLKREVNKLLKSTTSFSSMLPI